MGGTLRIAMLEDDPDQAELVALWLENAGHTVSCHAAGNDFLRAVRRDSFDAYVLDWLVPDLSGIDVLKKLRTEQQDQTPTIITTVKDEERSVVRALRRAQTTTLLNRSVRRNWWPDLMQFAGAPQVTAPRSTESMRIRTQ